MRHHAQYATSDPRLAAGPLVTVPAPNGAPIEADPAFRRALQVLASLDDNGRALVQAFVDGGVRTVVVQDAPGDRLALYEPGRRWVSVAEEVARVAPGTLATLLTHEASHVQTNIGGRRAEEVRALGPVEACYADELRATLVELSYWQMLHPPDGKPVPAHDYEDWLKLELAAYLRDPDGYPTDVREWYADLCEPSAEQRMAVPHASSSSRVLKNSRAPHWAGLRPPVLPPPVVIGRTFSAPC